MGREIKKRVTIYDVAKHAGVAPGTASRALNRSGYVRKETLEKVEHSAKVLRYVPNTVGRSLKTMKTGLICLAIPDTSNPIYFRMIQGVQSVAQKHGYSMLLYYTNGNADEERHSLRLLRNNSVDGLILIHFSYSPALRSTIEELGKPVVLCSMSTSEWASDPANVFDTISIDVYKGIYDAVSYLIAGGHRRIVYLAGKPGISVYQQRFKAYQQALTDHGIPYSAEDVFWHSYDGRTGEIAAADLLKRKTMPGAVCASNDLQAIGFYKEMLRHGIDPRKTMSIVGVDNTETMQILNLPSVDIREEDIGCAGASLLFERLNETHPRTEPKDLFIEPKLAVRSADSIAFSV